MLFENNVILKTYDFKTQDTTIQITDFFNKAKEENPKLSYLGQLFLSEKINPIYDAMIKNFKEIGKVNGSNGYGANGGGLSRKTNRKTKKTVNLKKTKYNRNKK